MSTFLESSCIDVTLTASPLSGPQFDVMDIVDVTVRNYGCIERSAWQSTTTTGQLVKFRNQYSPQTQPPPTPKESNHGYDTPSAPHTTSIPPNWGSNMEYRHGGYV